MNTWLSPTGTGRAALDATPAYPRALLDVLAEADLGEEDAYLAFAFAGLSTVATLADRPRLAVLAGRLFAARALGHTRLRATADDRALLDRAPDVWGSPGARRPLILDEDCLYLHRTHAAEVAVAAALGARLSTPGRFDTNAIARAVADLRTSGRPSPSDEQAAAIVAVLSRGLGLLTGGPGTGKTTTALGVARCLLRLGVDPARIALAAPTGKAAARLHDSLRAGLVDATAPADLALAKALPTPQTLHRLLGYAHGRFHAGPDRPLPHAAVLVDESSMIDLELMEPLLAATPLSTPLLLMGDADQLPSVSEGALFRDLAPRAIRLNRLFRVDTRTTGGHSLAAAAQAIQAGDAVALQAVCPTRDTPDACTHDGCERVEPRHHQALLRAHFDRHYADPAWQPARHDTFPLTPDGFAPAERLRLDGLFSALARARILAVTLRRPTGVQATNAFFHSLLGGGPSPLPGEPVVVRANDYDRALWNGDQGIVLWTQAPGRPRQASAVFPHRDGYRAFPLAALEGALELAHALSVHKAQGSEFAEVVLLLPDAPCPLLTRELLYTAVTRARRAALLCASDDRLTQALQTQTHRESGIPSRLSHLPL